MKVSMKRVNRTRGSLKLIALLVPVLLVVTTGAARAAEITVPDFSFTPDGSTTVTNQTTDIKTPNGDTAVLVQTPSNIVYLITTFTFGAGSDAHLRVFFEYTGGQDRLGVEIQDTGLVQTINQGDPGDTTYNFSQDMAGETVVLLVKQMYHADNDSLRTTVGTGDDNLMNVWVNPTRTSVEGSGLTAGDLHTLWNSYGYGYLKQEIRNESTPGTAGDSSITKTVILTGANATFARALSLALPPAGTVIVIK